MKQCTKCGEIKDLGCFHKGKNYVDGVKSECKICLSEYHKARHKARYKKKPPEYFDEKRKAKNEQKAKEKQRIIALREAVREAEKPKREAENRRKRAEYNRLYRKLHPGCRRIEKKNRKLKVRASGKLSPSIVDRLKKSQRGMCVICMARLNKSFHIDHIIPIAKGGSNTDDNVQLLCPKCNISKSDKHPVDFMQSCGFLL
jgi:5-methylcytosine-specific restriction endonuclease McrA